MLKKEFGKRLKFLRHIHNLTQATLAEKIDVSVTYLSNIERGLASPSFDVIHRMCTALNTNPANLFLFPDPKNTDGNTGVQPKDLEYFYNMAPHTSWVGTWTLNPPSGEITLSDALHRILGLSSKKEPTTLQTILDRIHPDDRERVRRSFERLVNNAGVQGQRFRFKGIGGTWRYGLSHMEVETDSHGGWTRVQGIMQDITDWVSLEDSLLNTRHQLERYVRERTREISDALKNFKMNAKTISTDETASDSDDGRFRRFADNLPAMVYHLRLYPEIRYEYVNPYMAALAGYTPQDFYDSPDLGIELIHPEDRDRLLKLAGAATVPEDPIEIRWILSGGRVIWTEHFCLLHLNSENQEMVLEGIGYEITERKTTFSGNNSLDNDIEENVEGVAGKNDTPNTLDDNHGDQMGSYYREFPDGRIDWSDQILPILEFDRANAPAYARDYIRLIHPDDRASVIGAVKTALQENQPYDLEYRIITGQGNIKRLRDIGRPVAGWNGADGAVAGTLLDVTRPGKREEDLVEANRLLRVQVREINHRVKNNMQVLSSLLNLQVNNDCGSNSDVLRDVQAKVSAIAMIHDILYRSDNMKSIRLKDYVESLAERSSRLFSTKSSTIQAECKVDPELLLSPDQAFSCGLILCELITNACKHAFAYKDGVITIRCALKNANQLTIIVSDNGSGLSDAPGVRQCETFGLSLVRNLAENQLGGVVQVKSENGTEFKITFPLKPIL